MSTRMLIDARHSEETRVTIVKGSRVEEFDYESSTRKQLKGNIYLARVTRVEPSLQAAFVEYGGNRHGFLAFSEIHPDYYQIPHEDREALLAEETADAKSQSEAEEDLSEENPKPKRRRRRRPSAAEKTVDTDSVKTEELPLSNPADDAKTETDSLSKTDEKIQLNTPDGAETPSTSEANPDVTDNEESDDNSADVKDSDENEKDEAVEEVANRRRNLRALKRRYNIQEVIKRRQVLLIQVVKEERGNKGAALTTYMSLAGRYCVLMPNSTHSGGISRKISNISDRRKLKEVISSLDVPEDMGLIVRTAGMQRTKAEIKRDYDYLLRLWNGIRDLTLKSTAPACVYEEGNLIKRTIRDLYVSELDEILVEGENGYRSAKDFMKLLMPSHAKKVQHYKDRIPLFHRYQVESQLEAMYQPIVQLRSGGYIVINPTEALISIDVNSGRATKEHNIEETAIKTNLEAAEEVARQLRLRDMAGLVVIDFIDMEDRNNNRSVERKMKDFLKSDRARIQVGRISSFGLMEMSRQRLRPNLLEISMETCQQCAGTGIVRSVESAALMTLRHLEEEGIRNRSAIVRVATNPDVAVYLLNKKRSILTELERQYSFVIEVLAKPSLGQSDIELTHEVGSEPRPETPIDNIVTPEGTPKTASSAPETPASNNTEEASDDQPRKKRRRRRRRRRGASPEDNDAVQQQTSGNTPEVSQGEPGASDANESNDTEDKTEGRNQRRRRGSRGGRSRRRDKPEATPSETSNDSVPNEEIVKSSDAPTENVESEAKAQSVDTAEAPTKKPVRRRRVRKDQTDTTATDNITVDTEKADKPVRRTRKKADTSTEAPDTEEKKPVRTRRRKTADQPAQADGAVPETVDAEKPRTRKRTSTKKVEVDKAPEDSSSTDEVKKPVRRGRKPKETIESKKDSQPQTSTPPAGTVNTVSGDSKADSSGPKRKGWWQRTFG